MFYKVLLILSLTFTLAHADNFKRVNPSPSNKMLENKKNAQECLEPIKADEGITTEFKYGCFCGKNYPNIRDKVTQDFRDLAYEKRIELIEQYYSIKPYDDIDAICMQHDICYLYKGKKAKICNNTIYDEFYTIADKFNEANKSLENEQCRNLTTDMASVFKTFFTMADDEDSIFDFGASFFTTGISIANKTLQESIDTISNSEDRYPNSRHKCLLSQ
jgi:hypothetical protein